MQLSTASSVAFTDVASPIAIGGGWSRCSASRSYRSRSVSRGQLLPGA